MATTVLVLLGSALTSGFAAAVDGPTLVLSQGTAKLGEYIGVTGSGFPIGAQLQVEICGIGGSSNSCAIAAALPATADARGGFHQSLPVVEPPTPCPCTVHAVPFAGPAADPVDVPITIPGLRYLPQAARPAAGTARLLDAALVPDSPFLTQFGAAGSAQVTLTFADLGGGPAPDPGAALTLSRGGRQIGRYPVVWTGGDLAVGGRRSLVQEITLPGGWFRDYEIGVQLGPAGTPVTVRTLSAAVRPWGEVWAPAVLLTGVLCLFAGRRRRSEPVRGLPVRESAVPGRRGGAGVPEPFLEPFPEPQQAVHPAPDLENATAETPETSEAEPPEAEPPEASENGSS
jgi:hypothetical protein